MNSVNLYDSESSVSLKPKDTVQVSPFTDSVEHTKEFLVTNRGFEEINPVSAGYERCRPGHFFGPCIREHYIIHYIQSGKGYYIRKNECYTLSAGDLFLIRPTELCKYYADAVEPWTYIWIGFSGKKAVEFIETTAFQNNQCVCHNPNAEHVFVEIQNTKKDDICLEFFLCSKIYEIFTLLYVDRRRNEYVEKAINYIHNNYGEKISVEQIAKLLSIDRRYLGRLFYSQTGMTPKEYLIDVRLQNAFKLLQTKDYTISEVAKLVGYDNYGSFFKVFKNKYGVSPAKLGQYRTRQ